MRGPKEDIQSDAPPYEDLDDEAFPPLPPPTSPGQQEGRGLLADGEDGEVSRLADVPDTKRRSVKRPRPKLDSQRLISEKGLPALRSLFHNVHFKGKGHEAEDLRLLMQKMENWAHRLYPRFQFEDFIDKVEKLGAKKEVQTCLKRIRLDMPLTHEDFTERDGEEDIPHETHDFRDPELFSNHTPLNKGEELSHSTPAPAAPSLTEEQRRRMELNRQRALEKRLARQQQLHDAADSQTAVLDDPPDRPEKVEDQDLQSSNSFTQLSVTEPEASPASPQPPPQEPPSVLKPCDPDQEEVQPGPSPPAAEEEEQDHHGDS
ncbi:TIMELESS-interacting protein [Oryzias melastigma]|uniref:TIMELESS-interacting protein n=1 Tax=Oryzias melastigma TaxID=30732 RepID=A0A3B3CC00_ORYME|nr:TIMELESS-interacting protein [Oryzias melastigma]XP_024118963.1 TIMELESS-interacting protein [Oryzias melastigma]XP_024118964.1 TIMELESS-interacting protein [Oryzias melastigma]XP_024118965.1 TIMELESS-interacting protein [Oryzias melastigma]XP_024118966.1 TIMELESS-interacting protein [Oryzias melastigma]